MGGIMFKSIKEIFSPTLNEYEQQMLDVKKYNMKHYGTVQSQGYTPFKKQCGKGCADCQCRPKPPQGEK